MTALLAAACADAVPPDAAAHVDGWVLTSSELAELLVLAQPYPLTVDAASELARHWVGAAAFATKTDAGADLLGDDAYEASMWLERREAVLSAEREARLGERATIRPEAAYAEGTYRLFAHVLRGVTPTSSGEERDLQRRTAQRILERLVAGGSWDAAVAESEDGETRDASGLLGLLARGELPPALDRVAFQLRPGQVSSVVESPVGFHILYRPRYEDVDGLYAARLRERWLTEADAAAADSLLDERAFELSARGLEPVRRLADAPMPDPSSSEPIASWGGGALDAGTVARYLTALPAAARSSLADAPDPSVEAFVREVAAREIRWSEARSAGVGAAPDVEAGLRAQHADEVEQWRTTLDAGADDARDGVRAYLRRLAARGVEMRTMPPLFESWLLEGVRWGVVEQGVRTAVERARSMVRDAG